MSTLTTVLCGTLLGLTAVSCADKNFDWEDAKSQNPEYTFRQNFESLVGPIDPNQSWDFSSNGATLGTRAITSITTSSVNGLDFNITNSYNIISGINSSLGRNKSFYDAIKTELPDGKTHEGASVVLVAPENGFYVYPVTAQGSHKYSLYVKVGNNTDVKVFEKNWNNSDKAYCNGMAYDTSGLGANRKYTTCNMGGLYIEAPVGTPISIYITGGNIGTNKLGTGSSNAIYVTPSTGLPEGLPSDVSDNAQIKFIGIEDNAFNADGTGGGDKDFNDLVLAIIGKPYVPESVIIKDETYDVTSSIRKRYMVEDLGSTAQTDIDFNDLVVDMVETSIAHHKVTYENGEIKSDEVTGTDKTQTAQIRAMGGTLDFLFMLTRVDGGVTKYKPIYKKSANVTDVTEMVNTDPTDIERGYANLTVGAPFTITGWDPDKNNVAFYVSREEISTAVGTEITTIDTDNTSTSGNLYNSFAAKPFSFPEPGEVPYIIAFDVTKNWRQERQKICSHWLTGTLNGNAECSTCGSNETDYTK